MIGEIIAEYRKKRGYSLSELAELTNVSKSNISNIERNLNSNPSLDVIKKIAKVLELDPTILLAADDPQYQSQYVEKEWVQFISELKKLGVEKEELDQYKTIIEFIKWKNQNQGT